MICIPIPLYFCVGPVLELYKKDPLLISKTTGAIPRLYPMLFVRVINESLKNYIQNLGHMSLLGFVNIFNIVLFVVYSWFNYDYLGEEAYWINMLTYELIMLSIHTFFLLKVVDQKIWDFSISIFNRLKWFFLECIKTISVTPLELMLTYGFNSYNGDKTELAAFSLFMVLMDTSYSFCLSIVNYPKAKLNYTIGRRNYGKAKKQALYYLFVVAFMAAIVSALFYVILSIVTWNMPDGSPYKPYFERCSLPYAIVFFVLTIFCYLGFVGFTIELKMTVLGLRIFIGVFVWSMLMYLFLIKWDLKVFGMILADIID